MGSLPWRCAREAEGQLSDRDRRALSVLRVAAAAPSCPDTFDTVSRALAGLVRAPIGVVTVGDPALSGRTVGASIGGVANDGALWSRVRARRLYDPDKLDEFTNRPVNTSTLAFRFPDRVEAMHGIWRHLSVAYQLRSVVAEDGVFSGYVGVWRSARDGGFDLAEHGRMLAALPQLTDLLIVHRALRSANVRGLAAALDAFDQCAFLLLGKLTVYANREARQRYPVFPAWLRWAGSGEPGAAHELARVTRLDVDGRSYALVIPRSAPADPSPLEALPLSLRQVAELMADGRSDKEIAVVTGYTLATSRTFATRVLARLGLHGRGELVRLMRGR